MSSIALYFIKQFRISCINTLYSIFQDHAKSTSNFYDGIVASEVIEHVNNQELFVKSCVHALKPGGRIFFTTPNRTRWSQFFVIFFAENVLKTIPQGAHQYEKFITPNELTFLLERSKYIWQYLVILSFINHVVSTSAHAFFVLVWNACKQLIGFSQADLN